MPYLIIFAKIFSRKTYEIYLVFYKVKYNKVKLKILIMYCRECGKEIADNARFCQHCGTAQDVELQNKLFFYLKKSAGTVEVLPGKDESTNILFELILHRRCDYSQPIENGNGTFVGGPAGEFELKIYGLPQKNELVTLNNWSFGSSLCGHYCMVEYNGTRGQYYQKFSTTLHALDIYQNVLDLDFECSSAARISDLLLDLIKAMFVLSMFDGKEIIKKCLHYKYLFDNRFKLFLGSYYMDKLTTDEILNISSNVRNSVLYKKYDEFNYMIEALQRQLDSEYKSRQSNSN